MLLGPKLSKDGEEKIRIDARWMGVRDAEKRIFLRLWLAHLSVSVTKGMWF